MASDSIFSSTIEKSQWVVEIRELLDRDDLQKAIESPPSIFQLPDSIRNDQPDVYSPRRVALGPYHHFCPELYKMELYKLEKAKQAREKLRLAEFHQLGNELKPLDLRIRECFDKFLEMDGETLTWMMLVDGLFLLRLLVAISENSEGGFGGLKFPLSNFDEEKFYPSLDKKVLTHYEILSDILMLENQIPLLVLEGIFPSEFNKSLAAVLYDFYVAVSPFLDERVVPRFGYSNSSEILEQSHHLLHFMYLSILLIPILKPPVCKDSESMFRTSMVISVCPHLIPPKFIDTCWNVLGFALNFPFIQLLKQAIDLILTLLGLLKAVIKPGFGRGVFPAIPSASELERVKVKFQPTSNKILDTRFDEESATVFLPIVSIDALSEVVFRNLVAFEAIAEANPPCLARYVSLMNGLIVTPKDVKILKKENIICSRLETDEEVVQFFKGIKNSTSSFKGTRRPKIHCVTEDSTNSSLKETNRPQMHNRGELGFMEENIVWSPSATDEEIGALSNRMKESASRLKGTSHPEMHYPEETASESMTDEVSPTYFNEGKESAINLQETSRARRYYHGETAPKSSWRQKTEIYEKIKKDYEKGLKGMVGEINKYYESCWRVKATRFMNKYGSLVLICLVILIIVLLIILVIVRLACSFLSCPKIIKSSVAANVISLADV